MNKKTDILIMHGTTSSLEKRQSRWLKLESKQVEVQALLDKVSETLEMWTWDKEQGKISGDFIGELLDGMSR